MLETFFRFPPISKISVQVVHTLQNMDSLQCHEMTLEVQTMGSVSPQSIEDDLQASLAAQSASCKASSVTPVEQLAHCIASLRPKFSSFSATTTLKEKLFLCVLFSCIIRRVTIPCAELIFSVSFLAYHPSVIRIDVQTQYSVPHLVSPSSFSRALRDVSVDAERVLRDVNMNEKERVLRDVNMNEKERVLRDVNMNEKERALHNVHSETSLQDASMNSEDTTHSHNAIETTLRNTNSPFKKRMRSLHTYKPQERMSTRDDVAPLYKHAIHILSHTRQLPLTRTG